MAQLGLIRQKLAEAVARTGLRAYPYVPANIPVGPEGTAVIDEDGSSVIDYDTDGGSVVRLVVRVYAGMASKRSAAETLDGYRDSGGERSIKAAVESDNRLGGSADSVRVTAAGPAIVDEVGQASFAVAELFVEVMA